MFEKAEVISIIKNVLSSIVNDENVNEMPESTSLKGDLGIDSMNSLILLMRLEEKIDGFQVDPETLEASHFEDIGSISEYVFGQLDG